MKKNVHILLTGISIAVLPLAGQGQTIRKPTHKPVARPTVEPVVKPKPPTHAVTQPAPVLPAPPARASRAVVATSPFEVGTNIVNLGIGLGNRYGYGTGYFGGSSSVSPAISLSFERGILSLGSGVLGLGVFAGYQGATYKFDAGNKWKYNDVVFTVRGAFHYPVMPQLDVYGGLGLGVRRTGSTIEGNDFPESSSSSVNELASGLFVGGRYFFTENIGAFTELGYDQTYLKAGISAKF